MDTEIKQNLLDIQAVTGWSQPRLASELGISQPTVNRLLNGQPDCKESTSKKIRALRKKVCGGRRITDK